MLDRFAYEKMQGPTGLSAKSVNDILTIIGTAMSYAEQEYGYRKPKIRRVKENRKEMRVLSVHEQQILVEYLLRDMDLYKLGVLLALYTGLRIGELCALHWDDIKDDCIFVNKSFQHVKVGMNTKLLESSPKTAAAVRAIPLPSSIQSYVEVFRDSGSVLKTRTGKQVEPRVMQMNFQKYVKECSLEKTNFHALRHTFATRCIEAGFDVKTTLNRYVHSSYELKRHSMEKLTITM